MKISLVHPSRDRVARAEEAAQEWWSNRSGDHTIEHIVSIDADDPARAAYATMTSRLGLILAVHPNRTMIEAANRGAARASGDLLVVVSDDFGCPPQWDRALASLVDGRPRAAVLVGDAAGARIMTLPILTRAYYRELGYVYYPGYRSMFADDDLTATARRDGVLVDARHLVFPHRHYSLQRSAEDATYLRQNSHHAWWSGWALFEQRRMSGFGANTGWWVRVAQARVAAYYRFRTTGSRMRRRWLDWIPSPLAAAERRVRNVVLRWAERAAALRAPE